MTLNPIHIDLKINFAIKHIQTDLLGLYNNIIQSNLLAIT